MLPLLNFSWNATPACVPCRGVPDGPLTANGDLGVVLGGPPGSALGPPGGKPGGEPGALGLYFGKNDFWGFPGAVTYHASFQHFSPGFVLLGLSDKAGQDYTPISLSEFSGSMNISHATVHGCVSSGSYSVAVNASVMLDPGVLVADVVATCDSAREEVALNVTMGSDTIFGLPLMLDSAASSLTLAKASVHDEGYNSLLLTSCSEDQIVYNSFRKFNLTDGTLRLAPDASLGRAPSPPLCIGLHHGRAVTSACDDPAINSTRWTLSAGGQLVSDSGAALSVHASNVSAACPPLSFYTTPSAKGACQSAAYEVVVESTATLGHEWSYDPTSSLVHSATSRRCLAAVPRSRSNNIAMAASIFDGRGQLALPEKSATTAQSASHLYRVRCGAPLRLAVSVVSQRDAGEQLTPPQLVRAAVAATRLEATALQRSEEARLAWWAAYYNRSSFHLGGYPALERYIYSMLYLQRASMREGKVAPGLWGPFSTTDFSGWSDQMTLDYNFQVAVGTAAAVVTVVSIVSVVTVVTVVALNCNLQGNFWAASGTNHPELVHELYATMIFDSRLVPLARARATLADWSEGGWPDRLGGEVMGMSCGPTKDWDHGALLALDRMSAGLHRRAAAVPLSRPTLTPLA